MRRTVWGILLVLLILAVVMQAVTVVERRHYDDGMPATIESGGRVVKIRGLQGGSGTVTTSGAVVDASRQAKASASRGRSQSAAEREAIVWTGTVESSKLPKGAAYDDALDRARNLLTHELNLSQLPTREFVNKWIKLKYDEIEGPHDSVIGETYSVKMDLQVTGEVWRELADREREYRVKDRMQALVRLSVIATTLLGCIAGYIRLDEFTKGYYTGWLRLLAIAVATCVTIAAARFN